MIIIKVNNCFKKFPAQGLSPYTLKVCCPNSKDLKVKTKKLMAFGVAPAAGIPELKSSSYYCNQAWVFLVVRVMNDVLPWLMFEI